MSLQGEEIGKIRYTLSKKEKKKRRVEKERNDRKTPKIINNLREKEREIKKMWRIKNETEGRQKGTEGKSIDVFQCFNVGNK